jgi:hypothetical protein
MKVVDGLLTVLPDSRPNLVCFEAGHVVIESLDALQKSLCNVCQ